MTARHPMTPNNAAVPAGGHAAAKERIARLIDLVEQLGELVAAETDLLQQRRPQALAESEAEKSRLASVYAQQLREIKADPAVIGCAARADKDRLRTAVTRFNEVMEAHARKLVTVKSVTESMVRAVVEEVQKRDRPADGYSRDARLRPAASGAYGSARTAMPVAVNQTV